MQNSFNYSTIDELQKDINTLCLDINLSENIDILQKSINVHEKTLPNALAVHPMEGCDGTKDGIPDALTIRRYERFASGGAGLIWFEAVAVVPEGRANPRQLCISKDNVSGFTDIFNTIMDNAHIANGEDHTPLIVMQLTHSGRFSVPVKDPAPVIAYHNPILNEKFNISPDHPVITDAELELLEDKYVEAAMFAKQAGFHGVDIKGCHRYLVSELLSAYSREGKYGGSFENRTRFMLNIIDKIKAALGNDFIVCTRLNLYDGIPYPYGWGVDKDDFTKYDLTEPLKLVGLLYKRGVRLINITMGTPYYNPHVNRPYDKGGYESQEHPLVGIARLINGAGQVQNKYPDMTVVGTGYSWLRHLAPYVAAGTIESGKAKVIGFGRGAFAYPDFANDIIQTGEMDKKICCITCSKCTELMRAKSFSGCVIRDAKVYGPLYKRDCMSQGG